MLTQNITEKINLIAGIRVEQTNLEYQGKIFDADNETLTQTEKIDDNYLSILPGLHFNYLPNKNSNLRFAWTNTIARPNYFDLVPYQEINRDDSKIFFGNPELKPTKSMNFDLMYEHFFKSIGIASAGLFYKDISNIISWEFKNDYTFGADTYDEYRKPENIGDATLYGFEASFTRRLDFLPSVLKNLTFYGNYTYVKSKLENIEIEGRENEDISMSGSPEHTYNISLAYDTKKLDVRVSFNHASAFLNANDDGGIGSEKFFDFYYDKVNYLDLNAEYKVNKNWDIYINANNLLNQPLRTYWGESDRTGQAEYYGIKLQLGLKFKF
jgi:TonB-dependent receptor